MKRLVQSLQRERMVMKEMNINGNGFLNAALYAFCDLLFWTKSCVVFCFTMLLIMEMNVPSRTKFFII